MTDELLKKELQRIDCSNYYYAFKKLFRMYPLSDDIILKLFNYDYTGISSSFLHFKELYLDEYNKSRLNIMGNTSVDSLKPLDILTVELLVHDGFISEYDYKKYLQRFKEAWIEYGEEVYLLAFNYSYSKLKQMIYLGYKDPTKEIRNPIAYFITSFNENLERSKNMSFSSDEIERIKSKYFH